MKNITTKRLNIHLDDRGSLFEALRSDDTLFDGKFGQIVVSTLFPGAIKAWHRHKKQVDYTCCVRGNIKLLTVNEQETENPEIQTFFLGEHNPVLVKIPPGTWHGYTPVGNTEAIVVYVTNNTYDPKNPDEERKAWDAFGKEIWGIHHK